MTIAFNNPIPREEEGTEGGFEFTPVEQRETTPVAPVEGVQSQTEVVETTETPPVETVQYGGITEYLPEAAQYLYDKGHIKHIPEGFNTEELDLDSYEQLLSYNKEQDQKEFFTQGLKSYESQLHSRLSPLGRKIVEYSLDNQNVTDEDIQGILQEVRTQEYYSNLDPEQNPERVVKEYYKNLGWDDSLVDQKLAQLIESGGLEFEAKAAKPHLDKIAARVSAQREKEDKAIRDFQSQLDQQLEAQTSQQLKTGKLNGVDLDRETAQFLYSAVMNKNVPVQLGKQTVEMGYAEALMREQKYKGNVENVMLSLLVLREGPKALEKYFSQPLKNKIVEEQVRDVKFGARRRGTSKKPVNKDFNTGITFNMK